MRARFTGIMVADGGAPCRHGEALRAPPRIDWRSPRIRWHPEPVEVDARQRWMLGASAAACVPAYAFISSASESIASGVNPLTFRFISAVSFFKNASDSNGISPSRCRSDGN